MSDPNSLRIEIRLFVAMEGSGFALMEHADSKINKFVRRYIPWDSFKRVHLHKKLVS
jgi:hypothetical protein